MSPNVPTEPCCHPSPSAPDARVEGFILTRGLTCATQSSVLLAWGVGADGMQAEQAGDGRMLLLFTSMLAAVMWLFARMADAASSAVGRICPLRRPHPPGVDERSDAATTSTYVPPPDPDVRTTCVMRPAACIMRLATYAWRVVRRRDGTCELRGEDENSRAVCAGNGDDRAGWLRGVLGNVARLLRQRRGPDEPVLEEVEGEPGGPYSLVQPHTHPPSTRSFLHKKTPRRVFHIGHERVLPPSILLLLCAA